MNKAIPYVLVAVAVALLAWGLLRGGGDEQSPQADGAGDDVGVMPGSVGSGRGVDEGSVADASSSVDAGAVPEEQLRAIANTPEPSTRPPIENRYDMEAEVEARLQVARDTFGEDGPVPCSNACDCPEGHGCQMPSGVCIPGLIDVPCCGVGDCSGAGQCVTAEGGRQDCAPQ